MSDYLTIKETAELLRVKPDTVRERIYKGVFKQGVHYFKRRGMRPLFKRAALIAWLEGGEVDGRRSTVVGQSKELAMPMARGYTLGG